MIKIDLVNLDANLAAEIANDTAADWQAYEADYDGETVSNQCYHIVHSAEYARGGIVFVGSGCSGVTAWTDAATPDEVLARYVADEMLG